MSRRRVLFIAKLLVALLVMTVLVRRIQPVRIGQALGNARLGYFGVALALSVLNLYLQFCKWRYLVRLIKPEVSLRELLASLFAGFTLGFITPGRVGEFGRVVFVKDRPWVTLLGFALLDKLYAAAILYLGGTASLLLFLAARLRQPLVLWPLVLFAAVVLFLLYYFVFHPEAMRTLLYSINITLPFREKIKQLIATFDYFGRRQAWVLLGLCAGFYVVYIAQFCILTLAFEPVRVLAGVQAATATLFVKTLVPISLGDLGVRERAAVEFFSYVHVQDTTAFNASLMLFVINVLLPSLFGLGFILREKLSNGGLGSS
ncbi:MAG: lysylphosphatidylglycerol synthase transmembrane domain-containing protein [bacterium]|nr:flippase-like domain-containing protein [candidate division KSB1 bacterium]MDH7559969.1 lysylphosphatidylglycerol synthase transmembrane domain-containing protein [bacterium]